MSSRSSLHRFLAGITAALVVVEIGGLLASSAQAGVLTETKPQARGGSQCRVTFRGRADAVAFEVTAPVCVLP